MLSEKKNALLEWAKDNTLTFPSQDEDLFIEANFETDLIIDILNNHIIAESKCNLLISVLCITLYDNASQGDELLKQKVIKTLQKQKNQLQNADYLIMDYVKEVVYPLLDFVPSTK